VEIEQFENYDSLEQEIYEYYRRLHPEEFSQVQDEFGSSSDDGSETEREEDGEEEEENGDETRIEELDDAVSKGKGELGVDEEVK
jgi:hypothetical protein